MQILNANRHTNITFTRILLFIYVNTQSQGEHFSYPRPQNYTQNLASIYYNITTDWEGIICKWLGFQRKEPSVATDLFDEFLKPCNGTIKAMWLKSIEHIICWYCYPRKGNKP